MSAHLPFRLARLALICVLASPSCAFGQQRPPSWLTGAQLLRQRQQPTRVDWQGVSVRGGLTNLSKAQQIAILLDRRIDPERLIDLTAERVPLDELMARAADQIDAAVAWLGPLAYVGPRAAAHRLRTLAALRAADARRLPKPERDVFEREASWSWPELAEPRTLVAELATTAHVEVEGVDLIPHDLWPAADLPRLSWTDRLTLLANEFDLTFRFADSTRVRLVPIVEPVVIERRYPAGKQAAETAARWRRLVPDAEIDISAGKLVVRGRLEDHELLRPAKPGPEPVTQPGVQVYTLTVREQPIAAVLNTLRASSVELKVDEEALQRAQLTLDRRVSFRVERATLEELLHAALKPAGLTFVREGNVYKIVPPPSDNAD
ncbi:MAG TPA: STN domain-containing protein [Pirellulales bacterium]|nr:STN domain-containing protein [Pirellulales bacterium]